MSGWSRRDLFRAGAGLIGGVALLRARRARADEPGAPETMPATAPASAPGKWPYARRGPRTTPGGWRDDGIVLTPNGGRLPWHVVGGVKVFQLIAEAAEHQLVDGLNIEAWTYNGRTPGPTIEVTEGDRCRFYVTNRLPEPTTVHWHGIFVPNGMDGVAGLTQRAIAPGETYVYEFTMNKPGTFMYHPHYDEMTQIALGMQGMIVVHPRGGAKTAGSRRVRDHALMLNEWKVAAGTYRPDALEMTEFNMLTFNSKSFPSTAPILAEVGDLVRLRIGNLSPMEHHPIHLHGHAFEVVETDGGPVPPSARRPETTVLVPVGTVRVVEFVAERAGDWAMHCHMTHHAMNQMGHKDVHLIGADVADAERQIEKVVPGYMAMDPDMGDMDMMQMPENSVPMKGAKGPFGFIGMGGMFTIVKIRQHLDSDQDPGWYDHPAGTVAVAATTEQLSRDGIELPD